MNFREQIQTSQLFCHCSLGSDSGFVAVNLKLVKQFFLQIFEVFFEQTSDIMLLAGCFEKAKNDFPTLQLNPIPDPMIWPPSSVENPICRKVKRLLESPPMFCNLS